MDYGLHYNRYPSVLEGYSDANWISDADEMKAHNWVCAYPWRWRCFLEVELTHALIFADLGWRVQSHNLRSRIMGYYRLGCGSNPRLSMRPDLYIGGTGQP